MASLVLPESNLISIGKGKYKEGVKHKQGVYCFVKKMVEKAS